MKQQLIVINGAPGVGKSTVSNLLFQELQESAWLDGDSVWRLNPFRVNDQTTALAEKNMAQVLGNYLEAGFRYVIFSWVLHRRDILNRILSQINHQDEVGVNIFTLLCSEAELKRRFAADPTRESITERALLRLRETRNLPFVQLETTGRAASEVAADIVMRLRAEEVVKHAKD